MYFTISSETSRTALSLIHPQFPFLVRKMCFGFGGLSSIRGYRYADAVLEDADEEIPRYPPGSGKVYEYDTAIKKTFDVEDESALKIHKTSSRSRPRVGFVSGDDMHGMIVVSLLLPDLFEFTSPVAMQRHVLNHTSFHSCFRHVPSH